MVWTYPSFDEQTVATLRVRSIPYTPYCLDGAGERRTLNKRLNTEIAASRVVDHRPELGVSRETPSTFGGTRAAVSRTCAESKSEQPEKV